jgi:hypothetical protein
MRRSTALLLVIFVLLGALVWVMQQPGNPVSIALAISTTVPSVASELLISPNQGPLSSITIQDFSGQTLTIKKIAGQWIINANQQGPADQGEAESAAGHVLNLRIVKKLETTPGPAGTGLDKPSFMVSIILADGSPFNFDIGKQTVTGSGYYVKTSVGTVFILSKSEVDSLTSYLSTPPLLNPATPAAIYSVTPLPGSTTGTPLGTPSSVP